jgi:hypothetical protein
MLLFVSSRLIPALGFLLDAYFTGQLVGTFVISRVLLGIVEVVVLLVFVKVFKLKAYIGIIVSAVIAFVLYLLPNLLLSGAGSIPGAGAEIAQREAATTQTNIMLLGMWLVLWIVVDCGVAFLVSRRSKPAA